MKLRIPAIVASEPLSDGASPVQILQLAALQRQAGNNRGAEAAYRKVLEAEPHNLAALYGLATILLEGRHFEAALKHAQDGARRDPSGAAFLNVVGRAQVALGRLDDAVKSYLSAIRIVPAAAEIHVSLGIAFRAQGRHGKAIAAYRRAIELDPGLAVAHHNLANVLLASGEIEQAEEAYRHVLTLAPGLAEAHYSVGKIAHVREDRETALSCYRRALAAGPKSALAWSQLGNAFKWLADLPSAARCFREAIALDPDNLEILDSLGIVLYELDEYDAAIECFSRALSVSPDSSVGLMNLGLALFGRGMLSQAVVCYRRALELDPGLAQAYVNLGVALNMAEDLDGARDSFAKALELRPDLPEAMANLAIIHKKWGDYQEAFRLCHFALDLDPSLPEAHVNIAILYSDRGDAATSISHYRKALALGFGADYALDNMLMILNYVETADPASVLAEHREYDRRHAGKTTKSARRGPVSGSRRKLRLGYVSADFRRHSVAHFVEPLFASHDKSRFEVTCYYNHKQGDEVTERLRGYTERWINCATMTDRELAERVKGDAIDILIDLSGHTAGNRLPTFAMHPAPVQMTWLGYPTTSGMSAIDYRISDSIVDPEGYDAYNAEKLLRMPDSYFCFKPIADGPGIGEAPALRNKAITFGSFNTLRKLSEDAVELWSRVLAAVAGSRLVLKTGSLSDVSIKAAVVERFARHGISPERLEFLGWQEKVRDHLSIYDRIDIALDTFPYNGATTTCEALWMGVPVVTRAGATHASRMGASILSAAGLPELVTHGDSEFVERCTTLASDLSRLAGLRMNQRDTLKGSALLDATRFARGFEELMLHAWASGCDET